MKTREKQRPPPTFWQEEGGCGSWRELRATAETETYRPVVQRQHQGFEDRFSGKNTAPAAQRHIFPWLRYPSKTLVNCVVYNLQLSRANDGWQCQNYL